MRLSAVASMSPVSPAAAGSVESPRFSVMVYSGGLIHPSVTGVPDDADLPVAVDLSGLDIAAGAGSPVNHDHDPDQLIGVADTVEVVAAADGTVSLAVAGRYASDLSDCPIDFAAATRRGMNVWASMSVDIEDYRIVPDGEVVAVNGRDLTGPFLLVTASTYVHTALLTERPADRSAKVSIAAKRLNQSVVSGKPWGLLAGRSLWSTSVTTTEQTTTISLDEVSALVTEYPDHAPTIVTMAAAGHTVDEIVEAVTALADEPAASDADLGEDENIEALRRELGAAKQRLASLEAQVRLPGGIAAASARPRRMSVAEARVELAARRDERLRLNPHVTRAAAVRHVVDADPALRAALRGE